MSQKNLSTEEQIKKLSELQRKATEAVRSEELIKMLGGITIFAGIADFQAIQAARLIEQVILKSELAQHKFPLFKLNEDSYFYDKKINTRHIVKEIEKFLPVRLHGELTGDESKINKVAKAYLEATNNFLNYRNPLLHHIGSLKVSEEKIFELIQKSFESFSTMTKAHREFLETWQPFI